MNNWLFFFVPFLAFTYPGLLLNAQSPGVEYEEGALIDQQPFDVIQLTAAEGGDRVKVLPLPFPGRRVPVDPKPNESFEVRLVNFPDRRYEIAWRSIEKVDLYEIMVYEEAERKLAEKDFITAFQNLSYLMKNYPSMPRLEELRRDFLWRSAIARYSEGEFRQTLSALEELRTSAANYQADSVTNALSKVASSLIGDYQNKGDLNSAILLHSRLKSTHGNNLPAVREWDQKLQEMSNQKRREAQQLVEAGDYRAAREATIAMLNLFPDAKEANQLLQQINDVHPLVNVGVMQQSTQLDPTSLTNWPGRRAGELVHNSLFQFTKTGTEGGTYRFAFGRFSLSEDRQKLILSIDSKIAPDLNALALSQTLLDHATRTSPSYSAAWAAIVKSVEVQGDNEVIVTLRRPNVLPHPLLQWVLRNEDGVDLLPGYYQPQAVGENQVSFSVGNRGRLPGAPAEIIETFYDDPKMAINDLLRGEIDVLDQLYPADARRLATDTRLWIGTYALPSSHMLIPISNDPYLKNAKFRRALLYATDRQGILEGELLNEASSDDGRLLSGPFPIGDGQSDPLAYAYNAKINPAEYNPQLARLMLVISEGEMAKEAKKRGEEVPGRKTLIVGCPDFEFARVAVQAMIQQWAIVGIKAEMEVLPADRSIEKIEACDLLYVTATMWEPATDIERLLGQGGLAETDDPYMLQGMEKLRQARNWKEVRQALQDLHQLISYHLPVLPLWQVRDRFAVRTYVEGLRDRPVSLYQDVARWRINFKSK